MYNDDMSLFFRNRSIAMTYLNRLLIDEEIGDECIGIYKSNQSVPSPKEVIADDEFDSSIVHLIVAHNEPAHDQSSYNGSIIEQTGMKSIMHHIKTPTWVRSTDAKCEIIITKLCSVRTECVQPEKYKKFCKEGGNIRVEPYEFVKVERSVGEDIEDFVEQMELVKRPIKYDKKEINEKVITFHLSLLTDKEEKKMLASLEPRKDAMEKEMWRKSANIMRNPLVRERLTWQYENFKYETRLSQNEPNYALSVCYRKSFINKHVI